MESGPLDRCIQAQIVTLPGGKDKDSHPFILVNIPQETATLDITPALRYIISIFREETRHKGLTVIIDGRKGPWKLIKSCIRQTTSCFSPRELENLLVLRPDVFWDKQRVEHCTSSHNDGQVTIIPRSRLGKFVEQSQLPTELGGSFIYNHERWIENRLQVEEFFKDATIAIKELDSLHEFLQNNQKLRASEIEYAHNASLDMSDSTKMLVHDALEEGRELVDKIEHDNRTRKFASESESMSTPQDVLDTIDKIQVFISEIRSKQTDIEADWISMEKSFKDVRDLSILEEGVVKVTNWILGPAEDILNSKQKKVGYDVASAEQLRQEHEEIELLCRGTYGEYAELLHKIEQLGRAETISPQLKDLIFQKNFMDFVCRSFATRLERRRNILITSLRFFRLVSEYFDKTSEVFDCLVVGNKLEEFDMAEQQLKELQDSQASLDDVERELVREGEKLSDFLSMPIKDALGRDIDVDYTEDIVNVRDILDATTARKNIFSDSIELQKLTLEQITHIREYEKDAAEAVRWLDEIFKVMLKDHGHVGCSVHEIQSQKEEHQNFQETAKASYNYGSQLLNASLSLRQSCKLPIEEHTELAQRLRKSWQRLLNVSQEQMTRLRVSAVFHRSVEDQCNQMRDLREAVATMPLMEATKKRAKVRFFMARREKLMVEVGRMVRLGRLLKTRLKEPLYLDETMSEQNCPHQQEKLQPEIVDNSPTNNTIAMEAITERLAEVTGLAEELDQALQSAQQDCTYPVSGTSGIRITTSTPKKTSESSSSFEEVPNPKQLRTDDLKSDEEFLTASDCTLQHSRSSSYNTASECDHRFSPWWELDGNQPPNPNHVSKEKLVLAVGIPDLPPPKSVLKSSPESHPGKIVREVTETTHLKVVQKCDLGVASYVLTSETVRDKRDGAGDEMQRSVEVGKENGVDEELLKRLREVGKNEDVWSYGKQTIKSFL